MDVTFSVEGEIAVVIVYQSESLHIKRELNEMSEKLLLVGQFDEKLRRYIETFEALSLIVCEK